MTADEIIARLGLQQHPEGGHFREMYRAPDSPRGASTAIYFLLKAGERSHWHKVDAAEAWHWYAGAPLVLELAESAAGPVRRIKLGPDIASGERPQAVVPAGAWQAAESLGDWTLTGCTVAPGFELSGFTLAPKEWEPEDSH